MSLHPASLGPVPEETTLIARAAFAKGNAYLRLRDELGTLFEDPAFASLFPARGQPAESPWRLALVTLLQFAENLSDRQAAQAVRARIDWKYLLGLELSDAGFDSSVLSEFRTRLLRGGAEEQLLNALLRCCQEKKLLVERGRQRTDSTHVLARVRTLHRLECVGETMRAALNTLAVAHPQWLSAQAELQWVERYGKRQEEYRLPKGEAERRAYAEQIGRDGHLLLERLAAPDAPEGLRLLPAVELLRQVWVQQFYQIAEEVSWRSAEEGFPPASLLINSPYDAEAHYSTKRSTEWVGYKVHLTECCEADLPHLITHVQTTAAPTPDGAVLDDLHGALQGKGALPHMHLVDAGYVDAQALHHSRSHYGVDLFGPTLGDPSWQAKAAQGFAASDFTFDWQAHKAFCPAGKQSIEWASTRDARGSPVLKIKFAVQDCGACAHRSTCTRSTLPRRVLMIRPEQQHLALQAARARQAEPSFAIEYRRRAGIEGTLSEAVRALGLRQARYIGQAKTHLQHVATAAAINLARLAAWFAGESLAQTRRSAFVRLMGTPAAA